MTIIVMLRVQKGGGKVRPVPAGFFKQRMTPL